MSVTWSDAIKSAAPLKRVEAGRTPIKRDSREEYAACAGKCNSNASFHHRMSKYHNKMVVRYSKAGDTNAAKCHSAMCKAHEGLAAMLKSK